jgi:hypothetical protein
MYNTKFQTFLQRCHFKDPSVLRLFQMCLLMGQEAEQSTSVLTLLQEAAPIPSQADLQSGFMMPVGCF